MCTNSPHIQVTLLKQSISNIGRIISLSSEGTKSAEVDSKVEFAACENSADEDKVSSTQNLLPEFLEKNFARVICGPVDLANFVEFVGDSGVVTLTSPQLLKVKSKSFLIHIKAVPSKKKPQPAPAKKVCSDKLAHFYWLLLLGLLQEKKSSTSSTKAASKPLGSMLGKNVPGAMAEQAASKQKLENIRGCDWIQEISITVRRSAKSSIPQDR
jgi:baculoviral IAP repeat-containing protein 6